MRRPREPRRSGRDAGPARRQRRRRRRRLPRIATASLTSVGIQCALCHRTVDDSFAPASAQRLDGWANRDLNVGAIVALAPDLDAVRRAAGRRRGDRAQGARQLGPGQVRRARCSSTARRSGPTAARAATLIPPAFGLAGVNLHTWTGWGSRLALERVRRRTSRCTARARSSIRGSTTRRSSRSRRAQRLRQRAATTPTSSRRSCRRCSSISSRSGAAAAARAASTRLRPSAARRCSNGKARVRDLPRAAALHRARLEPAHAPRRSASTTFQAQRAPDERYRTTPLRGLWTHTKGGFYHDGRFPTLRAVVDHYDQVPELGLSDSEKRALVEFLKSL